MQLFDTSFRLNQFWWSNQFYVSSALESGEFMLGPPTSFGLFLSKSTTPVQLQLGLVAQAFTSTTRSTPGSLEAPLCRPSNGAYFVREVAYAPDGALSKLAADFSAQCSLGYASYVQGGIRYGSTIPAAVDQTIAVPGLDRTVNEGQPLVLDGSLSWNASRRLKSLQWTQLSGPKLDLTDCKSGVCNTYTPKVDKGGAVALLRLTATPDSGPTVSADVRIKLQSWHDTQSRTDIWGTGYVAGGADLSLSETDGQFDVPVRGGTEAIYLNQTPERVEWRFLPNGNNTYRPVIGPRFVLSMATGTALVPGTYSGNLRAGFEPGAKHAADFGFEGRQCNSPSWTALVGGLDRSPADLTVVNSGAVTFSFQCKEGFDPDESYGRFWIRYTPVTPPVVKISSPSIASAGQPFLITDLGSSTPAAPVWLRTCRQIFGAARADIKFTPDGSCQVQPAANTPDKSKLVVSYEIIDERGQSGVALAEIVVMGGPVAASKQSMPRGAPPSLSYGRSIQANRPGSL